MAASATANRRMEWLRHQREATHAELVEIGDRAAEADRDLSDAEQAGVESRRAALERLDGEIATEAELVRSQQAYTGLMAEVGAVERPERTGGRQADVVYRSAGEYLLDFLQRDEDPARAARFERYRANQITTDNPGIIPTPILGPVWTDISSRRPAVEAATVRPLPAGGKTFSRPFVSQHTLVDSQTAEKTALPSQALKIDPRQVTKLTKGGWVNLSYQDRDWTDPAILDILVADLAAMYAQATDAEFCTQLVAVVTQTVPVGSNDAAGWLAAIYDAAALVAAADNRLPNTFWVSIDVWSQLGSLVDGAGRPLFPTAAPSNGMGDIAPGNLGGTIAGMRLAVDSHFPPGTGIIGDNAAAEFYETVGGQVTATEPSLLGTAIAFYGYMATCFPQPSALVKLTAPPLAAAAQAGPQPEPEKPAAKK